MVLRLDLIRRIVVSNATFVNDPFCGYNRIGRCELPSETKEHVSEANPAVSIILYIGSVAQAIRERQRFARTCRVNLVSISIMAIGTSRPYTTPRAKCRCPQRSQGYFRPARVNVDTLDHSSLLEAPKDMPSVILSAIAKTSSDGVSEPHFVAERNLFSPSESRSRAAKFLKVSP